MVTSAEQVVGAAGGCHPGGVAGRAPQSGVVGATMVPIAAASLAALTGLFTVLGSRAGDRRAAPAPRLTP
ncbi:hypothetical protein ONA70_04300 [Micromonospora yasonensis]|uniref:hypothetical protein n=1 Tax=Micromonospora yasonensis TaxID=1128667 RepID=UPI00222E7C86|nr:hypothetical protein [Micromonospora yasonensis]MCW3839317.1 hypothetical protein [Micromonospora yasonensis]